LERLYAREKRAAAATVPKAVGREMDSCILGISWGFCESE